LLRFYLSTDLGSYAVWLFTVACRIAQGSSRAALHDGIARMAALTPGPTGSRLARR
jgi:hypothetical protein